MSYLDHCFDGDTDNDESHQQFLLEIKEGAKNGELSVKKLITLLKKCPPNATIWTGGMFAIERFQSLNIDDDGRVCLLTKEESMGLRRHYGKEVT